MHDDDDSIFNLVLQLQRYDNGDAPEVQSTQPVKHLLHTALSLYYSVMDRMEVLVLQNKMT